MAQCKVTVVGAGFVGATTAQRIVEKDLADVVLIDIVPDLARGKALDIMQSAQIEGFRKKIEGTSDYAAARDSDIVVITAGLARQPGMSRDDLLLKNAGIMSGVVNECARVAENAILIIVTNPLDVMTWLAWKKSGFDTKRVIGMAGALDSARYACFVSEELHCLASEVDALVLGGHGDQMVPVPERTLVRGKAITQMLEPEVIEQINQRTRDGGAEIVKYLKTGSAFYAPSASVVRMAGAIIEDRGEVIPSCVYVNGPYGIRDIYCGVPARLGRTGVREVVEIPLTDGQKAALQASAEQVRSHCQKITL